MSKHSITRSRRGSPLPSFRGGQRGCARYDFLREHTQRCCSTDPNRGLWGKVDGDAAGMALFGRAELEDQLRMSGFSLARRIGVPGFWSYCVRKNT